MLIAPPCLHAAAIYTKIINAGELGVLCLLVLLFVWNAINFPKVGHASLVHLAHDRAQERRDHK